MDHISGVGGYAYSPRQRRNALTKKGKKALLSLDPKPNTDVMVNVHEDTDALRKIAERFLKKRGLAKESLARFSIDPESGLIFISIVDAMTGEVELKMSPEELIESLKVLEETDDNDAPLSSFFVDLKI